MEITFDAKDIAMDKATDLGSQLAKIGWKPVNDPAASEDQIYTISFAYDDAGEVQKAVTLIESFGGEVIGKDDVTEQQGEGNQ